MRTLAALVAVLALIVMAMSGSFGPTESTRSAPTPSRPASRTPAATATVARAIIVTLTEQELTKAAQDQMPMTVSGITVTDPRVRLEPGRLTLTATGRAFFVSGPIVVVATPIVTGGTPGAKIESATFAGFALPTSTKQDIADTFSRVLTASIPAGVRVTSVTINAGTLVVQAQPA
jgi:hypothetical protein